MKPTEKRGGPNGYTFEENAQFMSEKDTEALMLIAELGTLDVTAVASVLGIWLKLASSIVERLLALGLVDQRAEEESGEQSPKGEG